MPELALPENFQGVEGILDIYTFDNLPSLSFADTWDFVNPPGPFYYRPRYLSISGRLVAATVGTLALTFYAVAALDVQIVAPATRDLTPADGNASFTWSTEVGTAYTGTDTLQSGPSNVVPMPFALVKGPVFFQVVAGRAGGADGTWLMDTVVFQVERFPPGTIGGGDDQKLPLYLLGA
jgi:hypothetical protein